MARGVFEWKVCNQIMTAVCRRQQDGLWWNQMRGLENQGVCASTVLSTTLHMLLSLQEGKSFHPLISQHIPARVSCMRGRRCSEPLVSADATLQPLLFMSGCAKQSQTSLKNFPRPHLFWIFVWGLVGLPWRCWAYSACGFTRQNSFVYKELNTEPSSEKSSRNR